MWLSNVTIQVWPSGGDLAATVAPTTPAAPGLFSTTICQPVVSPSLAAMMRAIGSVPPPGGKGTMNLIGPFGQSAWALTMPGTAALEYPDRGIGAAPRALQSLHEVMLDQTGEIENAAALGVVHGALEIDITRLRFELVLVDADYLRHLTLVTPTSISIPATLIAD